MVNLALYFGTCIEVEHELKRIKTIKGEREKKETQRHAEAQNIMFWCTIASSSEMMTCSWKMEVSLCD